MRPPEVLRSIAALVSIFDATRRPVLQGESRGGALPNTFKVPDLLGIIRSVKSKLIVRDVDVLNKVFAVFMI